VANQENDTLGTLNRDSDEIVLTQQNIVRKLFVEYRHPDSKVNSSENNS
jgi:hypothetical protein